MSICFISSGSCHFGKNKILWERRIFRSSFCCLTLFSSFLLLIFLLSTFLRFQVLRDPQKKPVDQNNKPEKGENGFGEKKNCSRLILFSTKKILSHLRKKRAQKQPSKYERQSNKLYKNLKI